MKKIFFVILLLSVLIIESVAQKARDHFKTGCDFISSKNYEDAIIQFNKAIEFEPDFSDAYIERAKAYEKINELEKAADDYNRAAVFDQKSEEVHYNAARLNYELEKYDKALTFINTSLSINKKFHDGVILKTLILIALEKYTEALMIINEALDLKSDAKAFYCRGTIYESLNNYTSAEEDFKKAIKFNKNYIEAYIKLAYMQFLIDKLDEAMKNCNTAIEIDNKNVGIYIVRSKIYAKQLEYPKAINDISKNIVIEPDNKIMYIIRGKYYQDLAQHQYAINDYTKAITLDDKFADAYFKRAHSYEQILNYKAAIKDYEKLIQLSEFDAKAQKMLTDANERLFELNREINKPVIKLIDPPVSNEYTIKYPKDKPEMTVKGIIEDESDVKSLFIDSVKIPFIKTEQGYEFIANMNIADKNIFTVNATDAYDNTQNTNFTITRTEINLPKITVIAPYASDNNEIYLDTDNSNIYIEGQITDESLIKTILIDGVSASFQLEQYNPKYTANINVSNKNKISIRAIDENGNETIQDYIINREGIILSQNNPMGKTWIVFIENTNYNNLPSLDGPSKDVSVMREALARYKVHKIIHKKDMTKIQLEKFFSIELRDLVRSNRVDALMLWYAGHGKYVNETGYWIPVDGKRDDEFTYYNINTLKASLQSYTDVTHTLIVTDACESGPTFYHAMRDLITERSCDDWQATKFKSSQVFSSAGYELAVDNSQFTRTFANSLMNNPKTCIPIESIVMKVTTAVVNNNQQKPKFGRIDGLTDENGTFFFVTRDE